MSFVSVSSDAPRSRNNDTYTVTAVLRASSWVGRLELPIAGVEGLDGDLISAPALDFAIAFVV